MSHISQSNNPAWPVLTRYDQDHLTMIALPLGGIGTGSVALGGRGDLRQWEIVNRPSRNFIPNHTFFTLYTREPDGSSQARVLEGRLEPPYEGPHGSPAPNAGLPRFRSCTYEAAYPLGQVILSDPHVPVEARIQAFNPLIPADTDNSSLPVAVLRFVLTNTTSEPISAAVCGNLQNFIGKDGVAGEPADNYNTFRQDEAVQGIFLQSRGVHPLAEQYGTLALTTTAQDGVTYRTAWAQRGWNDTLLDFWDDFSADGELENREQGSVVVPMASLAVRLDIPAHETRAVTFLLTWHFPNRQTWTPLAPPVDQLQPTNINRIGNYYTTRHADAWAAATYTAAHLGTLESQTLTFVKAFCDSDLPPVVKEAALYNLSTLRSQTCFRTEDGYFFGWEGCDSTHGSCHGSCTHVWNYEQATAFLFGELSLKMREIEFLHATNAEGLMSFRTNLPLHRANEFGLAAADGQMGCLMKLYRDWQLSGNTELLRTIWPQARKALEFCWLPGSWDGDQDGVMEGCQHNTMDVEYFGPNPQMGIWYLGALRATEEMATALDEPEFAEHCHELYQRGRAWLDTHLFNGEYYEQIVQPPASVEEIAPGLRVGMGARDLADPDYQIGSGCLIDQLVGQYMAHVCGLGYLVEPDHIRQTLQSIMRYNFHESLADHANHMRSYILNDEPGMLMCSYPRGKRPRQPFPYYTEVMTGFEYTAGVHMLYENLVEDGLRTIAAIRSRYTGRNRNPFDEAECGYHYARAMASWAAVLALSGFHYSALNGGTLKFAAPGPGQKVQHFWSNGHAWGTCRLEADGQRVDVTVEVLGGKIVISSLEITGVGKAVNTAESAEAGATIKVFVPFA